MNKIDELKKEKLPFTLTKSYYFILLLALLWGLNIGWIAIATFFPVLDISRILLKANSQSQFDEGKLVIFLVIKVLVEGILCILLFKSLEKYAFDTTKDPPKPIRLYVELGCTLGIVLFIVVQVFVGNMRPMADSRYSLVYASDTPMDRLAYLMLLTPFLYSTVGCFNIFFLDSFMAMAVQMRLAPPSMDDDADSEPGDGDGDTGKDAGDSKKGKTGFFGNVLGAALGIDDLNPLSNNNGPPNVQRSKFDDSEDEDEEDKKVKYIPPSICPKKDACIQTAKTNNKVFNFIIKLYVPPGENHKNAFIHFIIYVIEPSGDKLDYYFLIDVKYLQKLNKNQNSLFEEQKDQTKFQHLFSFMLEKINHDVFRNVIKPLRENPYNTSLTTPDTYINVRVSFMKDLEIPSKSLNSFYSKDTEYRLAYAVYKESTHDLGIISDADFKNDERTHIATLTTRLEKEEIAHRNTLILSTLPPKEKYLDIARQIKEDKLKQEEDKTISFSDNVFMSIEKNAWHNAAYDPKSTDENYRIVPEKFDKVYREIFARLMDANIKFKKEEAESAKKFKEMQEKKQKEDEINRLKTEARLKKKELKEKEQKRKDQEAVDAMMEQSNKEYEERKKKNQEDKNQEDKKQEDKN